MKQDFDDNIFKNSYTTLSQFSGWTLEKIANLAQNVHLLAANGPGKKRYLCTFVKYFHAWVSLNQGTTQYIDAKIVFKYKRAQSSTTSMSELCQDIN